MKTLLIAKYSLRDIIRSKLMFNALWISVAVFLLTFVTSEFSFGQPQLIARDFGLSVASFASNMIAILMGASLLSDDIENRTVYITLSRPVKRHSFMLGKLLGMCSFLFLNIVLINLSSFLCIIYFDGEVNSYLILSNLFSYLEAVVLLLVVVNFSLITNKVLSIINTIIIYVLGHAIPNSLDLPFVTAREGLYNLLKSLTYFLPNLANLNLKNYVYESSYRGDFNLFNNFGYGIFYIGFLLLISLLIFNNKELN